ncbi:hypothetical protein CXB51_026157 [Gossypium anomalum]|uniref:Peroxidase n=1 Tax=Gossypium anomalum TaxID=47600 RepID=A0A8J5YHG3_9ROSI|nr:hypothetical protein CXB51_026157 [Gossypium anomalum]
MASKTCSPSNKLRFLLGMVLFSSYEYGHCPVVLYLLVLFLLMNMATAQLSSTFYSTTCPKALSTIKSAVNSAVSNEARMGASLLRLHFHDCFVNASRLFFPFNEFHLHGCDGSILLDDTANMTGEKTAVPNSNSARDLKLLIPSNLRWRVCALVLFLVLILLQLLLVILLLLGLITAFSNKGFTAKEMVALSGSHTIGQARCTTFRTRIYNETNIDSTFATSLRANCPSTGGDNSLSPLDTTSSTSFDNAYFKNLQGQKGLLHSDQQLFSGGSTDSQVNAYSSNLGSFTTDFANAMVKMGNLSPLTGTSGQIRTNCRKAN